MKTSSPETGSILDLCTIGLAVSGFTLLLLRPSPWASALVGGAVIMGVLSHSLSKTSPRRAWANALAFVALLWIVVALLFPYVYGWLMSMLMPD